MFLTQQLSYHSSFFLIPDHAVAQFHLVGTEHVKLVNMQKNH